MSWALFCRAIYIGAALFALLMVLTPALADPSYVIASYYGASRGEHLSRYTASGALFRPMGLSAAHRSLAFGTKLRVSFRGRSVVVTVDDRGPFVHGRSLDLSLGAARAIGLDRVGVARVSISILHSLRQS